MLSRAALTARFLDASLSFLGISRILIGCFILAKPALSSDLAIPPGWMIMVAAIEISVGALLIYLGFQLRKGSRAVVLGLAVCCAALIPFHLFLTLAGLAYPNDVGPLLYEIPTILYLLFVGLVLIALLFLIVRSGSAHAMEPLEWPVHRTGLALRNIVLWWIAGLALVYFLAFFRP